MINADEIYLNLLRDILEHPDSFVYEDTKRGVNCHQLNSAEVKFDMRRGFPLLQTKDININVVLAELLWFLRGENNIKSLIEDGCNIWNKDVYNFDKRIHGEESPATLAEFKDLILNNDMSYDVGEIEKYGYAGAIYGTQWRNFKSVDYITNRLVIEDQFATVIDLIKRVPMARRCVITAWNPLYVFDDMQCALPPCHWAFEILPYKLSAEERVGIYNAKYHNSLQNKGELHRLLGTYIYSDDAYWCGEKHDIVGDVIGFEINDEEAQYLTSKGISEWGFDLKWNQRSVDTFLGLPFNIASYGALMLIIEKLTGYTSRYLIGNLSNVHIYANHLDAVKEQLRREPSKNKVQLKLDVEELEIADIYGLRKEDFKLINYLPQERIKAEMLAISNEDWNK